MRKLIYQFILCMSFIGFVSCDKDFEELNVNPNTPDRVAVEPQMLLPGIIRKIIDNQQSQSFNKGGIVIQHLTKIRGFEDDRYLWTNSSPTWGYYNTLRDVYNMYDIASENQQENYMAIALIMKSWIFSILTDSFGEIPYTEAIKGKEAVNYPKYDTQEAIYQGMLADLLEANSLINVEDKSILNDIMFDGNMLKWKKLSNSLRVRMLMRISDRVDVSQALTEIVSAPETYPIFESNSDNAVLKYLSDPPNQFPMHSLRITDQAYHVMSSTLMDKLNALNDPRRAVFAKPTPGSQAAFDKGEGPLEYLGIENGQTEEAIAERDPATLSNIGRNYFDEPNAAEGKIMTYPELQFILAEAAYKNWIPGSAESYYTEGVQASFAYYDVSSPEDYFQQPGAKWENENGLELIGTQKWIHLYWNGYEAWFDWRRTHIPHLSPSIVNYNEDKIPVRFEYPAEEQNFNTANYNTAIERQGPDNINTRVWWDVD